MIVPTYRENIPCQFEMRLIGQCQKKSSSGWCHMHIGVKCARCGKQAVKECEFTDEDLSDKVTPHYVCEESLCTDCEHQPYVPGKILFPDRHIHLTKQEIATLKQSVARNDGTWHDSNLLDEDFDTGSY